jgi:xylulokinase
MTAPALLAVDLGTSSIKVTAFDVAGRLLAARRAETPTDRLPEGRAEHDVDTIWRITAELIRSLVEGLPAHRVEAVGVTSVGEAGVPLDDAGLPVRPAFAWFDARGGAEAGWWRSAAGADRIFRITGQPLDSFYSVNRLLWMRTHEPASFARTRHWLGLGDLVLHRLSGAFATDFSLASRTLVFDQARLDWSDELLALAGLDRALFPAPMRGGTRVGSVTAAAAALTGLRAGVPVVVGGHDRLCAAFAVRGMERLPVDSTGSAESLMVPVDDFAAAADQEPGVISCYADVVPDRYVLSARVGYATALTDWYAREIAGGSLPADIDDAVGWPLRFSGLIAYPSFGRLLAPDWNEGARAGAVLGLTLAHRRGDILQALVEAVGYSLRANLDWMEKQLGRPIETVRVEGSLARSRVWMQLKADVTGRRMEAATLREATSLGAALLAGIGAGIYPDHAAAAAAVSRDLMPWEPSPLAATYARVYREAFTRLSGLVAAVSPVLAGSGEDTG